MGSKPRPIPTYVWVLETDLDEIHAAAETGGGAWAPKARCGEELLMSTLASEKDAGDECAKCKRLVKRQGAKVAHRPEGKDE